MVAGPRSAPGEGGRLNLDLKGPQGTLRQSQMVLALIGEIDSALAQQIGHIALDATMAPTSHSSQKTMSASYFALEEGGDTA